MIHREFFQGSEEWKIYKLGRVSGSRLNDILAESKTKGQKSASWRNYIAELCIERLTGKYSNHFTSKSMDFGTFSEPIARIEYESINLVFVDQVGFIDHPSIPMCGSSPDGLVGNNGCIEIKCPNTATHIDRLNGKPIDAVYYAQGQWVIECAELEWCDFISFDPDLPENCRFYCRRIMRDEPFLINARSKVEEFLSELESTVERLKNYVPSNT